MLNQQGLSEIRLFAEQLARKAGQGVLADRQKPLSTEFKHVHELVTNADVNADKLISEEILKRFPDHIIVSEESAPESDMALLAIKDAWIVDPIDGTVNFAHGHNQSAVSIAFAHDGDLQCGVVYNPFTDEMFSAQKGGGATLNGESIAVSSEQDIRRCLIATGFPYGKAEIPELMARLQQVLLACADLRRLGSAALDICWVAMGRLDGYYESLSLWDFAAAQVIAKEAGASYGHFKALPDGVPAQFHTQNIVVANPSIYKELLSILQQT